MQQIICNRCRRYVPVAEIKYVQKLGSVKPLCSSCRGKEQKKEKPVPVTKVVERVSYICERCNYRFKHDPYSGSYLHCPYCGKGDKVKKAPTSDKLIKEIKDEI